jgi:predicted ATPase/class 3 adenylate cyclase
MVEQPTGTVTMLFTDIEGSTRLLERLGPGRYREALDVHRRLLREAFARHCGYEVDYEGDAFFVAFASAQEAVAAASEAQKALAQSEWPEEGEIRVRMGLHTGEPVAAPPKYVGLDVHKAARIMAAGHGGQVLVSQATQRLVSDLELVSLGEHRLKDLLQPEPLYQVRVEGLPSEFPALKSLGNRPTNLPVQPNLLIGREREVAAVTALLREPEVRLVTLTGSGGTGKTRLALQAGAELLEEFGSGVFFVSLAPIRDPALVVPAIAQALAVREVPGEELADTLAAYLEQKQMLLVLDNFEQVLEAAADVARLVDRCPEVRVLVTSRERLRLRGERMFAVPPLALVDPTADADLVLTSEAVALFVARAGAATSDFAFGVGDASLVAEICARLDGLPLAIELAAARTVTLTPQALLRRLGERLPLLTGGARDVDSRQQTLHATIDWSYQLLTAAEQRLFARLSVFVDGCRLEAAEAICGADGGPGSGLLDALDALVDKSLLRVRPDADDEPRYWMLETIREFAAERLRESPVAHEVSSRHAAWYADLADRADEQLRGPDETDWLARLEADLGNLRAALAWLETTRAATDFQKLTAALWHVWGERGHLREGTRWLESALELGDGDPHIRVRALNALCTLLHDQGRVTELRPVALEIDRLSTELGDMVGRARARTLLAWAAEAEGDLGQARRLYEEAVALARANGDGWWLSVALNNLGNFFIARRELDDAAATLAEALAIAREVGFADATGRVLSNLGLALVGRGDVERAAEHLTEALTLFAATGSVAAAEALNGLAAVANAKGNPRRAARLLGASNRVGTEIGRPRDPHETSLYEETLAAAHATLGDQAAAELLAEGEKMRRDEAIAYALEAETSPDVE